MGDPGHSVPSSFPRLEFDGFQAVASPDPSSIPAPPLPFFQKAVVTPEVKESLNMALSTTAVREPLNHEAVVRMCYTGLCRSDACFATGPLPGYPATNHIGGHEGIGQIVKAHRPELLGRFVGLRYLGSTCGSCAYCLNGLPTSCPHQTNAPKQISGSFQEYLTAPVDALVLLPDHLLQHAPDPAALCGALCSGSAALMAVRAARIDARSVVVVVGAGGAIGNYAAAMAQNVIGAKVIGVDIGSKVATMKSEGHQGYANVLLPAPADDADAKARDVFTHSFVESCTLLRSDKRTQRAADAVIVAASTAAAFRGLERYVCDGGWIVCSGVPFGMQLSLSIHDIVERNIHLTGCLMGGPAVSLEVMQYMCDGLIRPLTTHITMNEIPELMQKLVDCEGVGKIVAKIQEPLQLTCSP